MPTLPVECVGARVPAPRPLLAPLALALISSSALGQGAAGSPSGVSLAHGTSSAAGEAQSGAFTLRSGLAQNATGALSSSPNFQMRTGVTSVPAQVATDHPIVFGAGAVGEAAGGELVPVYGFNFTAPGAGANAVEFDGLPSAGTTTVSNTWVRTTAPAGVDGNANPLAYSSVRVTNANGSDAAGGTYVFRPALTLVDFARVGEEMRIRFFAKPGSFVYVLVGESVPGTVVPAPPPYGGSLEVLVGFTIATPLIPVPEGQLELAQPLGGNPALIGGLVELQILSFDDATFASGSFSNLLPVTLQPF